MQLAPMNAAEVPSTQATQPPLLAMGGVEREPTPAFATYLVAATALPTTEGGSPPAAGPLESEWMAALPDDSVFSPARRAEKEDSTAGQMANPLMVALWQPSPTMECRAVGDCHPREAGGGAQAATWVDGVGAIGTSDGTGRTDRPPATGRTVGSPSALPDTPSPESATPRHGAGSSSAVVYVAASRVAPKANSPEPQVGVPAPDNREPSTLPGTSHRSTTSLNSYPSRGEAVDSGRTSEERQGGPSFRVAPSADQLGNEANSASRDSAPSSFGITIGESSGASRGMDNPSRPVSSPEAKTGLTRERPPNAGEGVETGSSSGPPRATGPRNPQAVLPPSDIPLNAISDRQAGSDPGVNGSVGTRERVSPTGGLDPRPWLEPTIGQAGQRADRPIADAPVAGQEQAGGGPRQPPEGPEAAKPAPASSERPAGGLVAGPPVKTASQPVPEKETGELPSKPAPAALDSVPVGVAVPRQEAAPTDPGRVPAELVDRVASHVARLSIPRNSRIRIQLTPPSLGALDLRLSLRDGKLALEITADSLRTRELMEAALPQLRESLAQRAVEVERIFFSMGGSAEPSGEGAGAFAGSSSGGGGGERSGLPGWRTRPEREDVGDREGENPTATGQHTHHTIDYLV